MLPDPIIVEHEGSLVVRDDLLPGGTKRRAMHVLIDDTHDEYVYASPVYGAAQIALAYTCRDYNKRATILCAQRQTWHPLTKQAADLEAKIIEVPMGFLSNVQSKAKAYCSAVASRKLMPFGLDDPEFIAALANVARQMPVTPTEVWSITSSGVLSRALQQAWPEARFFGVQVGATPNAGRCETVYLAPEKFDKDAKIRPPFPSNLNYDSKAWRFVKQYASSGALFWNVM